MLEHLDWRQVVWFGAGVPAICLLLVALRETEPSPSMVGNRS